MNSAGIAIERLSFSYPEYPNLPARKLLDGVDLSVARSEIGLVLGASDEGKTTLARILGGLVPRFSGGSIDGTVFAGGADVRTRAPYDLVEKVGLVFQHPDEQIVGTRCDAEVAFALESLGVDRSDDGAPGARCARPPRPVGIRGAESRHALRRREEAAAARVPRGRRSRRVGAGRGVRGAGPVVAPHGARTAAREGQDRARARLALVAAVRTAGRIGTPCSRAGRVHGLAADPGSPVLRAAMDAAGILPPSGRVAPPPGIDAAPYLRTTGLSFAFPGSGAFSLEVGALELQQGGGHGPRRTERVRQVHARAPALRPARTDPRHGRGRPRPGIRAGGSGRSQPAGRVPVPGSRSPDLPPHGATTSWPSAFGLPARGEPMPEPRIGEAIERFGLPPAAHRLPS